MIPARNKAKRVLLVNHSAKNSFNLHNGSVSSNMFTKSFSYHVTLLSNFIRSKKVFLISRNLFNRLIVRVTDFAKFLTEKRGISPLIQTMDKKWYMNQKAWITQILVRRCLQKEFTDCVGILIKCLRNLKNQVKRRSWNCKYHQRVSD